MRQTIWVLLLTITGCSLLSPRWHWEKDGASEVQYETELSRCKASTYSGTDGAVTQEMVRRMQLCMEAKGWRRVENR